MRAEDRFHRYVNHAVGGILLITLLTGCSVPEAAVYAVYPHRRHVAATVRAFVDFLSARFAEQDLQA